MVTEKDFIDRGWAKYEDMLEKHADASYQKCVRGEDGSKLYFINAHLYDMFLIPHYPRDAERWSTSYEVQFWLNEGECFNVQYSPKSIEEAEQFFSSVYTRMNCSPYYTWL